MSKFKKSFRGYSISEVDEHIRKLEEELEKTASRYENLQNRFDEVTRAADSAKEKLAEKSAELEKTEIAYEMARSKADKSKREAESIGRIYIKAFESGRELACAPTAYINEYFEGIENASEDVRRSIFAAKRDFAGVAEKISEAVQDIKNQAEYLNKKLEELTNGAESVDSAYAMFGKIRTDAEKKMSEIVERYENSIAEYVSEERGKTGINRQSTGYRENDEHEKSRYGVSNNRDIESKYFSAKEPDGMEEIELYADAEISVDEGFDKTVTEENAVNNGSISNGRENAESAEKTTDTERKNEFESDDTASDFTDKSEAVKEEQQVASAVGESGGGENRGQNILNLLNKYKKGSR